MRQRISKRARAIKKYNTKRSAPQYGGAVVLSGNTKYEKEFVAETLNINKKKKNMILTKKDFEECPTGQLLRRELLGEGTDLDSVPLSIRKLEKSTNSISTYVRIITFIASLVGLSAITALVKYIFY